MAHTFATNTRYAQAADILEEHEDDDDVDDVVDPHARKGGAKKGTSTASCSPLFVCFGMGRTVRKKFQDAMHDDDDDDMGDGNDEGGVEGGPPAAATRKVETSMLIHQVLYLLSLNLPQP